MKSCKIPSVRRMLCQARLNLKTHLLKRSYNYTDNCYDDTKTLSLSNFVFQKNNSQCYRHC